MHGFLEAPEGSLCNGFWKSGARWQLMSAEAGEAQQEDLVDHTVIEIPGSIIQQEPARK